MDRQAKIKLLKSLQTGEMSVKEIEKLRNDPTSISSIVKGLAQIGVGELEAKRIDRLALLNKMKEQLKFSELYYHLSENERQLIHSIVCNPVTESKKIDLTPLSENELRAMAFIQRKEKSHEPYFIVNDLSFEQLYFFKYGKEYNSVL